MGVVPTDPGSPAPTGATTSDPGAPGELESALPSTGARLLAFAAIVVAGACGGLIGWAVTDIQVGGDSTVWAGLGGLIGAVVAAGGVAVVSVLVLRAMGEWHTIQQGTTGAPPGPGPGRR